ncbi:hypothetical protein FNV43_RR12826 [Rhamnella rubrinervis]|uniref:Uncharacterized protein n=1 Tax=Rhamnella rubrinervis TaxID=2594499 RepID=A0A8K0H8K9_9ROSA|nr:hypothetical protein FNV43_RR12826 [Rhamnella rubrinervis]
MAYSKPQLIPDPTHTTSTVDDDDGHADVGYLDNDNEDENKYPNLTHSLFGLEDMESIEEDPRASVIDMVKISKEEEDDDGAQVASKSDVNSNALSLSSSFVSTSSSSSTFILGFKKI